MEQERASPIFHPRSHVLSMQLPHPVNDNLCVFHTQANAILSILTMVRRVTTAISVLRSMSVMEVCALEKNTILATIVSMYLIVTVLLFVIH